ncbi:MAG: Uma2 family endonuclease [Eubacterium sp.]|nr:Uma2 family endonuclease [Eubacterium sp.]
MSALPIQDMSNTFVEHSFVINNFVVMVGKQIEDSLCRVLGEGVQYQWHENDNKIVIPDVSIICNTRDRKNVSLTGIPRMIMEVLSDSTEAYDRGDKMQIYQKAGVSEYWIADWRKRQVEIYLNEGKEDGSTYFYLYKTISKENKDELQLVMFPNLKTDFEILFHI